MWMKCVLYINAGFQASFKTSNSGQANQNRVGKHQVDHNDGGFVSLLGDIVCQSESRC